MSAQDVSDAATESARTRLRPSQRRHADRQFAEHTGWRQRGNVLSI